MSDHRSKSAQQVFDRAGDRCEYCLMHQSIQGAKFHIEHIVPCVDGGNDDLDNLCLACPSCNLHKSDRTTGIDPESNQMARLYHPRKNNWVEHFSWIGYEIVGLTSCGRATIAALHLNHVRRLRIREVEETLGLFPPEIQEHTPMISVRVPGFRPSVHGFAFPNSFPRGTPVFKFGRIGIGDVANGLCGGMIFAAMDCYYCDRPLPVEPTAEVRAWFARRLMASWNLPIGMLKYYEWQRRPLASRKLAGIRIYNGLTFLTQVFEWPRIKAELNAGRLAPLGLVKESGYDPRVIAKNHQVLAYGYDYEPSTRDLSINIYDPNYPNNDDDTLSLTLTDPEGGQMIRHSCEGPSVRGIFLTKYRKSTHLFAASEASQGSLR